mmetsp:Transcript_74289/g.227284  ORF Transcript_74289/g.227284 Transcript_74289/m.227284 type:complete len:250 (-) Transcript_74289:1255-2004(-)
MQPQQACGGGPFSVGLAWVHLPAENVAELLRLLSPHLRQDASIFEDHDDLASPFFPTLCCGPCYRLHLDLPVDAIEVTLCKDRADQLASLHSPIVRRLARPARLAALHHARVRERLRPGRERVDLRGVGPRRAVDRAVARAIVVAADHGIREVQHCLELFRRLELRLLPRAAGPAPVQLEELRPRRGELHLVFRRPVAVPHDSQHRQQFLVLPTVGPRRPLLGLVGRGSLGRVLDLVQLQQAVHSPHAS